MIFFLVIFNEKFKIKEDIINVNKFILSFYAQFLSSFRDINTITKFTSI